MTANYKLTQLVRNCIYQLKRRFGCAMTVYHLVSASTDRATGIKTETHTAVYVQRAIVLPANVQREVIQSVSALTANKKLVMGGTFDSGARLFIIDRRDVPSIDLTNDDWLIYKHTRYDIISVDEFEQRAAWLITARAIEGSPPEEDIRANSDADFLGFVQAVNAVIA